MKRLMDVNANFETCFVLKQDSGDVWAPPHPQDLNTSYSAEKKSSHFWQSAPVTEWSKEQVF
jgi:neurabin